PRAIMDRKEEWQRYFGGAQLFRRSLETRRQIEAMHAGAEAHQEFERLVATILGKSGVRGEERDNTTRPLTPTALIKIRKVVQQEVARPWARQAALAARGGVFADELERMVEQRELDADVIRQIIAPPGANRDHRLQAFLNDPRL